MKTKIFLFGFAVSSATFTCGFGFFCVRQYAKSIFSVKEKNAQQSAPAQIVVEQFKIADDSEEKERYENKINGYYGIIAKQENLFEKFSWMEVTAMNYENASEENSYEGTLILPEGNAYIKGDFKFSKLSIIDKFMVFETETIKGVSYKFSGKFTEKAPFWNFDNKNQFWKVV